MTEVKRYPILRCAKCGSVRVIKSRTGTVYCKEPGCGHAVTKSGRKATDTLKEEEDASDFVSHRLDRRSGREKVEDQDVGREPEEGDEDEFRDG